MAKGKVSRRRRKKELQPRINPAAAGIDIGATEHWVAVPPDQGEKSVRRFGAFTSDLYEIAEWLSHCGIKTVAMESTGVYWIPLFEVLERRGFEVNLVDTHRLKSVPGRKTDCVDCQWIQELHSYGLLSAAFRPDDEICHLRTYLRQRDVLVRGASGHIQHMQKALTQMNIKLQHVVSDITGKTGLAIIKAILSGERSPEVLARCRDRRCKRTIEVIEKSLHGNWRTDHLFELRQALELYEFYMAQKRDCESQIVDFLDTFSKATEALPAKSTSRKHQRSSANTPLRTTLFQITGVDLTTIDGIDTLAALRLISEVGLDMTKWASAKKFASWLALCPGNKVSGGKRYSGRTRQSSNRAAAIFRMCAQSLHRSQSALGAHFRRMRGRLGAPKAITATAHKIAKAFYRTLRYGDGYVDPGADYYQQRYRKRVITNLTRRAKQLGYTLIPVQDLTPKNAAAGA